MNTEYEQMFLNMTIDQIKGITSNIDIYKEKVFGDENFWIQYFQKHNKDLPPKHTDNVLEYYLYHFDQSDNIDLAKKYIQY